MAKIPEKAQELFEAAFAVEFATVNAEGQPNICYVGQKKVLDDETIYLSDQFFKKTLANIQANPKVAIIWMGEGGGYVVHGTARYVNEGPEFEEQAAWVNAAFEANGAPIRAKGGVFVSVDAVYDTMPGPHAGDQIA